MSASSAWSARILTVANVGDSRCVLAVRVGGSLVARRLTYDHKADDTRETDRVVSGGGLVLRGRVMGRLSGGNTGPPMPAPQREAHAQLQPPSPPHPVLAISRALGDHGLKKWVIGEPHIASVPLDDGEDCQFFILCCDGVFDLITDQQAAVDGSRETSGW